MCLLRRMQLLLLGIIALALVGCNCQEGASKKFLIYSAADEGSHHLNLRSIAISLIKQGHHVTFLLSSSYVKWMHADDANLFRFIVYRSDYTPSERQEMKKRFSESIMSGELRSPASAAWMFRRCWNKRCPLTFHRDECSNLLGDKDAVEQMLDARFDMLIGDDLSWCNALLAHRLRIRFVLHSTLSMTPAKHGLIHGLPHHPAYIPERQIGLSHDMSLVQRMFNTWMHFVYTALFYMQMSHYSGLKYEHDIAPEVSTLDLMRRAELLIVTMNFAMDFARPLPANVILIPPPTVGVQTDSKVPRDQQDFVDGASAEGVVLFSLGNYVNAMSTDDAMKFVRGLAKLRQKVLWHFTGNTSHLGLGNNTKVVDWIPMQTFMAHPNVHAVISHGGSQTLHQAAWFGLPAVGIPLFGDQFDNMIRAVSKGFALSLNFDDMTEESLHQAVTQVIEDPSFRANAQKLSGILRADPHRPADKAATWITRVTRHGAGHLRPKVMDMNFIQSNLLDVYGLFLLLGLAVSLVCLALCRCCCRCCARLCRTHCSGNQKMKQN